MLGSQLLDRQPFFNGADFGAPELSTFGMCHFRRAERTEDSWEDHDGAEFLFVLSGEACWEFSDGRLLQIRGGQAFAFKSGTPHRIVNGIYPPSRVIWLVLKPLTQRDNQAGLMPSSELRALLDDVHALRTPLDLDYDTIRALNELAQRLVDERIFLGSAIFKAEVRSRLHSALLGFWRGAESLASGEEVNASVRQLEKSLRSNVSEQVSIGELTRRTRYRHSQLYALFKREVGMSPNDYRQRLRIKKSCRELLETDRSVTEIGLDLGFSSSQYFARVFRKYVGTSPSEYRRLTASAFGDGAD